MPCCQRTSSAVMVASFCWRGFEKWEGSVNEIIIVVYVIVYLLFPILCFFHNLLLLHFAGLFG